MKKNLLLLAILAFLSIPTFAQKSVLASIDKGLVVKDPKTTDTGRSPYWIIVSNEKEFRIDTLNAIKYLDPQWMLAIDFPDNDFIKAKYGNAAPQGLVVVTINDKKFPNAFGELKDHMAFIDEHDELPFYDFTTLP